VPESDTGVQIAITRIYLITYYQNKISFSQATLVIWHK